MAVFPIFNPNQTTNAAGSFGITTSGYIQGMALDDPAVRNELMGGVLAPTETLPMWGGVGVSVTTVPVASSGTIPQPNLGGYVSRATTISATGATGALVGLSVYNQLHSAIVTPGNEVPLAYTNGQVNYYLFGSNARIPVACAPSLVSLDGNPLNQQVSWDFSAQQLVPYIAPYAAATPTGVTYTSATGVLALTFSVAPGPTANSVVDVVGSSVAALNGAWVVSSTASGGTILNLATVAGLGSLTPTGISIAAGGGAFPGRVLAIQAAGNMTVNANSVTGTISWNRNGPIAVVLI